MNVVSEVRRCASWPDRETERWSAGLDRYPSMRGLERFSERHEATVTGWRSVGGSWEPAGSPLRLVEDGVFCGWAPRADAPRLSNKEAERSIRRFAIVMMRETTAPVRRIPRRRADYLAMLLEHTAEVTNNAGAPTTDDGTWRECMRLADIHIYEALTWLRVCDTTDEVIVRLFDREAVAVATRSRRVARDPLRARFASTGHLLDSASSPVSHLGSGSPGYEMAGAAGRTKAGWGEVYCAPTHVSTAGVRNLGAVERRLDAQVALRGLVLSPAAPDAERATWEALRAWTVSGAAEADRVALFRDELRGARGGAGTDDWTDRAIQQQLSRARSALERHLRRAPGRAEQVAYDTGDAAFLAPVVRLPDPLPLKGRRRRPAPARVERIDPLGALQ